MFERFTKDARAVVEGAVGHSERVGAEAVEEEHLLLALLDREASRASFALASLGLTGEARESVERSLTEARRRGGLSRADADALSGLGIDLSEIVSRVEEAHGEGVLEPGRRAAGRWVKRRPFAQGAKGAVAQSLRIAVARHDRRIGDEHFLLALTVRPGVPAEVLADHGVTYEKVTRVLYGDGGAAKAG
ncbi:Clp protease N-terminal domain-containing protein [Streptomyces sp. SAS_270]|uniref:Clp protease N-terminal domain-containing protein n=1 Tax=Streptomyces sp. SAS_270 TaxID=3412748 RepID=UPI00403D0D48